MSNESNAGPALAPSGRPRLRRWLRRIAIGLAAFIVALTAASFAYNWATDGREKPATALYHGPFVHIGNTLVAYREWGRSGSPIVLLGGFAEPSWVWHDVGPQLAADHHRVIAVDLPPFGFTQRVGDPSLDTWVGLVEGMIRRLGLHRPLVVGHSLGAAVAAGVALREPADVSGVVLLDGDGLRSGGGGFGSILGALLIDPYFTSAYRLLTGSDLLFRQVLERALGPDRPPITRQMFDAFQTPFRVQGTAGQLKALAPHGIVGLTLADLARVTVPATVVWGQYDDVDALSAGRRSAQTLHAPFIVVAGAGHLSMLVRPAAVASAIDSAARTG